MSNRPMVISKLDITYFNIVMYGSKKISSKSDFHDKKCIIYGVACWFMIRYDLENWYLHIYAALDFGNDKVYE